MRNQMKVEFSGLSVNESFARMVISAFAAQLNPTLEDLADIKTSVSEAVTNAIIHGYGDEIGTVTMFAEIEGDTLTLSISDSGVGIEDVELARQPFYTSKPELERSGMGFTVMETFMDSLQVQSKPGQGTTVTMRKRIGVREAGESE